MIRALDNTIEYLLRNGAKSDSPLADENQVHISFDVPNERWQSGLQLMTINCYLYSILENRDRKTQEPLIKRENSQALRLRPPTRIDCSYCITAWSGAQDDQAKEEHHLLSEVLEVLIRHPTIPLDMLQDDLANQIPPYPSTIAGVDGIKNQPEFWGALNQPLKPSITYIVTLAMMLDDVEAPMTGVVTERNVTGYNAPAIVSITPNSIQLGNAVMISVTGFRTHFSNRSQISVLPADNVTIGNKTVKDNRELVVEISANLNASQGKRVLQIITDSEVVKKDDGLLLSPADQ